MSNEPQLTSSFGYNTANMIFADPISSNIPDSKPPISFKRIPIMTKYPNGDVGDLIFSTERLFSYGVAETINKDTEKVTGYSMGICLHSRDGATPNQKAFVETLDAILERCKNHLIEHREDIDKYDLELTDLKKMSVYYIKKEKGKVMDGATPTLYPKLIVSKKQDKILTYFFDKDGNPLNALDLMGKFCHTRAAIKIESIFIGKDISIQIKLYECEVELATTGMVRLLSKSVSRPASNPVVSDMSKSSNALPSLSSPGDGDDDSGSLVDSDREEEIETKKEPEKPAVKRTVKKVVKKTAA